MMYYRSGVSLLLPGILLSVVSLARAEDGPVVIFTEPVPAQVDIALPAVVAPVPIEGAVPVAAPKQKDGKDEKVNPQILALEAQFRPHYEGLLNGQLHLIRDFCRPNHKQQVQLAEVGNEALNKSLRAYAKMQHKQQHGMRAGGFRAVQQVQSDPSSAIAKAMQQSIKDLFTDLQQARYASETQKRDQFKQRATVDNLVALLDKRLILSTKQREQLVKKLLKGWQPGWAGNIEMLAHGNEYLPSIPDRLVTPVLNEKQKKIWRGLAKQGNVFWGGHVMMHGNQRQKILEAFKPDPPEKEESPQDENPLPEKSAATVVKEPRV